MQTAFLTGATGYIGAFLLNELVERTDSTVYCLVRADSTAAAMARLRETMRTYEISEDRFGSRVVPVTGDLGQTLFGLSSAQFEELAKVDAIYHCGALVNFSFPYAALKAPNVYGTREVLRLACKGKRKTVHYLSSKDVLAASHQQRPYLEEDLPRQPNVRPDGYPLSKWLAEQLVSSAKQRGVPAVIYRLGWTLGHTGTGASPANNFLLNALGGFLGLGILPETVRVADPLTVDKAARAILHISLQEESAGRVYHLWNPWIVSFTDVYDWVRSFGYEFSLVSPLKAYDLATQVDMSNVLYPLVPELFAHGRPNAINEPEAGDQFRNPAVECANLLSAIRGSDISLTRFDEPIVHRMLSYLVRTGFLKSPDAMRSTAGASRK
jgi:thioester reductase-like protein